MTDQTQVQMLHAFVEAAGTAFERHASDDPSRRAVGEVFAALRSIAEVKAAQGHRLPVCAHLDRALSVETGDGGLQRVLETFAAIEPQLTWRRRPDPDGSASANFEDGHGNAMVVGPGGLVHRQDAWLGVSLLGPHVRYPNHDHGPEEVYLVMSAGEFRHGDDRWFTPGIGGSFYNEPGINHAMRAGDAPLLAFWILQPEKEATGQAGRATTGT